jgi:hypothetical protein
MPTDVIIDPSTGQIYWNDSTGSPQSISIKGDAINAISFVGYSGSFSPGSTPSGASTLVTVNDNSGTDALVPGTSGFNLGSSTLRWNTFATNANLSGTLVVSDATISSSLLTGSVRFNGGIAISGNASIGQSLNFYNTAATFYTGFRAGTISANTLYTLPTAFPGSASVLQSDTSGVLTWVGSIGTATTATNINVVSASTSANHPVLFTPASGTASGAAVSTEPTFVYNPSTDILSVSGLAVTNTTASTNTTSGALIVTGGVGIGRTINIGGRATIGSTDFGASLSLAAPSTGLKSLVIRKLASQSANTFEIQDADGNALISTSFNAGSGQTGSGVFNIHANREIGDAGSETVFAIKNRSTDVFRIGRNGVLGFTGTLSASDGSGSFETIFTNIYGSRVDWQKLIWFYGSGFDFKTAGSQFSNNSSQLAISHSVTSVKTGIMILANGWDTGGGTRAFGIGTPGSGERTYFNGYGNLVINPNNPNGLHAAWNTMDLITLDISGTATTYSGNIILGKVEGVERFSVGPFGNTRITVGTATTATGFIVRAVASQTGNLIETQSSAGATNFFISPIGAVNIGASTASTSTTTGALVATGGVGIGGSIFGGSTISAADNIEIRSGKELRLNNTGNTFYTGIKAGANTSNTTYTFPTAFPGSASVLQSDTSGTLTWVGSIGTATTSQNINIVSASTSASHPVLFTPATGTASGAALSTESTFVYNPNTDILSVSGLAVTSGVISTSTTSGAFQVKGGVGITGNAFIGGTINVGSPITIPNGGTNASSFGQSGGFVYYDGTSLRLLAATGASINFTNGYYQFDNRVYATSFFANNAQMPNGSGVAGRVTIWSGNNTIGSDAEFTYDSTNNILNVSGNIHGIGVTASGIASTSTTDSASVNTGGLIVSGGAGIAKSFSIGGYLQLFNTNNYTSFVSASTANTVYTLPPTSPATGSSVLQSTSAGVMSWVPASSGGVATGVASRMAYYSTAGAAITDTYGFQYTSAGQGQTISIFGGAAIGSTIFVVSTSSSTSVRVGIGVSNPQFELEVNGEISATNKSFVINHPTKPGMKLRYGSLEGPENGVYVRGISTSNIIELPDYWLGLVDYNTITVHLTPIGKNNSHYFIKCEDNKVYIGTSIFKKINCFYSIWAERKDVPKLIVEY